MKTNNGDQTNRDDNDWDNYKGSDGSICSSMSCKVILMFYSNFKTLNLFLTEIEAQGLAA